MSFSVNRDQQKLFVDHFMAQVLDLSLKLVDSGADKKSPGETILAVGMQVIDELRKMNADHDSGDCE